MEVKTKFGLGEKVWCVDENKARQDTITGISMFIGLDKKPEVEYSLRYGNIRVEEDRLFYTKEELLKSL